MKAFQVPGYITRALTAKVLPCTATGAGEEAILMGSTSQCDGGTKCKWGLQSRCSFCAQLSSTLGSPTPTEGVNGLYTLFRIAS